MQKLGRSRYDITLQPVSGKGVPVYQGETLRITQVEGEQCVDFNCFNLHDYKERMSVGHTRLQGFRVREGHVVVSAPPRYRPMLAITHMADTCVTDLLGARCDATMGEREYDLLPRTNCQDTFAESIREYGLTPDDVHDSINLWMHTAWGQSFRILRNIGPKGDYVDLLALMDVLAVPIVCGSGDLGQVSNFGFKPIQVQVFEASADSKETLKFYLDHCAGFKNQRDKADERNGAIRSDRKLKPVAGYKPRFRAYPIVETEIEVEVSPDELAAVDRIYKWPLASDADRLKAAFMLWYRQNRMKQHWICPDGLCSGFSGR